MAAVVGAVATLAAGAVEVFAAEADSGGSSYRHRDTLIGRSAIGHDQG